MSRPETSPERATHTPGPWRRIGSGVVGADGQPLPYPWRGAAEAEANVALIASAPALLAALQQVVEMFGPGIDAGQSPTLDAARAAIAAATAGSAA